MFGGGHVIFIIWDDALMERSDDGREVGQRVSSELSDVRWVYHIWSFLLMDDFNVYDVEHMHADKCFVVRRRINARASGRTYLPS